MVMVSFKMDTQLQTVSNYFLLSLSVADFAIGVVSMPLYTVYLLMDGWPLGAWVCDTWLSLDYTMSNASVANLLLISFDRYFSVTRPLTYRARRTPRRAAIMISSAWIVSILMWTPWIFSWPFIEGKRSIPEGECYIQFLVTNQYLTVITAVAAFYLPVVILCGLYYKIYLETERRQRGLAQLQGGDKQSRDNIKSSEFSDDENHGDNYAHKLSDSSPDSEHEKLPMSTRTSAHVSEIIPQLWQRCKHCCKVDQEEYMDAEESSSSDNHGGSLRYDATPSSTTSRNILSLKRDTSLDNHVTSINSNSNDKLCHRHQDSIRTGYNSGTIVPLITVDSSKCTPVNTPSTDVTGTFSRNSNLSSTTTATTIAELPPAQIGPPIQPTTKEVKDNVFDTYTILIKLPPEDCEEGTKPTIRMINDSDVEENGDAEAEKETLLSDVNSIPMTNRRHTNPTSTSCRVVEPPTCPQCKLAFGSIYQDPAINKQVEGQSSDSLRFAMQAKVAARLATKVRNQRTRRKKHEQKQDKKAVKTLSAILLAFVLTWTPYNIFTLVETFCGVDCINPTIYAIGK